jgi:hypothetical protein
LGPINCCLSLQKTRSTKVTVDSGGFDTNNDR